MTVRTTQLRAVWGLVGGYASHYISLATASPMNMNSAEQQGYADGAFALWAISTWLIVWAFTARTQL
jgi:hypothetical protein